MCENILNRIYKPTPVQWRVIGDAVLWGCQLGNIVEIANNNHAFAIGLAIVGIVAKFLSNLPTEKNNA